MGNYKTWRWLLFLGGMWLTACVKDPQDIPSGISQDPVFGIKGLLDNQPVNINAGEQNWTFVPVVHQADSIHIYSAVLARYGCTDDCSPSWTFNLYEAIPVSSNEESDFLKTVATGPIDFAPADAQRENYEVTISTHPDLFANSFSYWQVLNDSTAFYTSEVNSIVGSNETFDVCFQSQAFAGCQYNQCIKFYPATQKACVVHFEARLENDRLLVLTARPDGVGPFTYLWPDQSTDASMIIQVQDDTTDIIAAVSVVDANGNQASLTQTIRIMNGVVDACYFPINVESHLNANPSASLAAGDLEIIYRDENGVAWRSTRGIQPFDAIAFIENVVTYGLSPANGQAYKVTLSTRVLLTNELTGETKYFDGEHFVIPLSHP